MENDLALFIDRNIINLKLEAANKDEAIKKMVSLLAKNGYVNDETGFIKDVYFREQQGPTGIGKSVAIPHGKSDSAKRLALAIAKTNKTVKWETAMNDDGWQDTQLIFLFCVPADNSNNKEHLRLLSQIAGKLANKERISELLKTTDAEQFVNLLVAADSYFTIQQSDNAEIVELDLEFKNID